MNFRKEFFLLQVGSLLYALRKADPQSAVMIMCVLFKCQVMFIDPTVRCRRIV